LKWSPAQFALLFSIVKLPIQHMFLYPFLPVHGWSPKKQEPFFGDSEHVCTSARCDFSSLHEFAYCIIPNSYLSGLIYFKEVSVPASAISPLCTPVHTVHTGAHYMHTVHTVHTAKGPPCLTSDMLLESFCCIV
jgi:hypothetical protein